ncbi:MAG: cache domain-containing sensor histidine kinase [Rectinemataceae bacterium]
MRSARTAPGRFVDRLSLSLKLNLSSLAIILGTVLIVGWLSNALSGTLIVRKTVASSEQTLATLARDLDVLFGQAEDLSKAVLLSETVQGLFRNSSYPAQAARIKRELEVRNFLDSIIEPRNLVTSMLIYGRDRLLASSFHVVDSVEMRQRLLRSGPFALVGGQPDKLLWLGFRTINYQIEPPFSGVTLVRPIFNIANNDYVGMLEANIDERTLAAAYSHVVYGESGRFLIVDDWGTIVSSSLRAEIGKPVALNPALSWVDGSSSGGRVVSGRSGKLLVTSLAYPRFGWTLIGVAPLSELLSDTHSVTLLIFLAGLVCVLLAMAISYLVSTSITRPVLRLSSLMKAAGQGDLEVRAEVRGADEIAVLATSFNAMVARIAELLDKVEHDQRQRRDLELSALQAQIKPHFLYNTLESICALAQLERKEDVVLMVRSLARFYRAALADGRTLVRIDEEIELVRNYVVIQTLRYADKIEFTFDVDGDIGSQTIPKLSVQPLVENAIYHGVKAKTGKGCIAISGRRSGDSVILSVRDDGIGMDAAGIERALRGSVAEGKRSFGLSSVDERIKLQNGEAYGLRITSEEGQGALVEIVLPHLGPAAIVTER